MAEFKDRLELALSRKGMKPAELSKLTGIGEGAISQYRKGAYKATQRNLEKMSTVLGVPISWLMGIADDEAGVIGQNPPNSQEGSERILSDKELLEAFHNADSAIQGLIRNALGLKPIPHASADPE